MQTQEIKNELAAVNMAGENDGENEVADDDDDDNDGGGDDEDRASDEDNDGRSEDRDGVGDNDEDNDKAAERLLTIWVSSRAIKRKWRESYEGEGRLFASQYISIPVSHH